MTRQIRRVSAVMLILFGALFINLNLIQVWRADSLVSRPENRRLVIAEYSVQRGSIVVDGQPIANSVETDAELKYLRVYDDGPAYAHLTGFASAVVSRSALEQSLNDELIGAPNEVLAQNLVELVTGRGSVGNTVVLTIDARVQAEAIRALGDREGAVVAISPRTGAILASYSNPTYDPNLLASPDNGAVLDAWRELNADPAKPLLDRVARETYPPGSTFKILVAAAALERGIQQDTSFPDPVTYDVPQTDADIGNYSGGACNDGQTITLADALRVSCNTVFAQLGVDLGSATLVSMAERFGFNRQLPYDISVATSAIPKDLDAPAAAQSAIGQRDVRMTPLHAALIAATIANEGTMLRPYVVAEVLDPSGRAVRGPRNGPWNDGRFSSQVIDTRVAATLNDLMIQVVSNGTGRRAGISGVRVGGKTGTADVPGQDPTVWFIGFAEDDVAVAVVLPNAGVGATGGGDAAPIAQAVMEAALGLRR